MPPQSDREANYEAAGLYTAPTAVPRQRTIQARNSWKYTAILGLEEQLRLSKQNVLSRLRFDSNSLLEYKRGGAYTYRMRLTHTATHSRKTRTIVVFFLSCYAISLLLLAPSLLRDNGALSSDRNGGSSNAVLSFLKSSIRGGSLGLFDENYDDDENLFRESDEIGNDGENHYFSACILWMDDNHRLEEWLAYHYYVLKLRHVVINVDPHSTTSPQAIADRWNGHNKVFSSPNYPLEYELNMTIELWNDTMYIQKEQYEFEQARINVATGDEQYRLATEYHKYRQRAFYRSCSKHLIARRNIHNDANHIAPEDVPSQWTAFHDTDEFLAFMPRGGNGGTGQWGKYDEPGYFLKRLNAMKKEGIRSEAKRKKKIALYKQQKLERELAAKNATSNVTAVTNTNATESMDANDQPIATEPPIVTPPPSGMSCLIVPRYKICSVELTQNETEDMLDTTTQPQAELQSLASTPSDALVPSEFVREKLLLESTKGIKPLNVETSGESQNVGNEIIRRFDTLRYKYQTPGLGNYGKSILDLSQADVRKFAETETPWQTHGVISTVCGTKMDRVNATSSSGRVSSHHKSKSEKLAEKELMQINHYLGSWESYNARPNDARKGLSTSGSKTSSSAKWSENAKSKANWLRKSKDTRGRESIVVRPWLRGFIRLVGGPRIAAHLLQDAGIIPPEEAIFGNEGKIVNCKLKGHPDIILHCHL